MLVKDAGDAAGHLDRAEEFLLLGVVSHGGITDGASPHWGDQGADGKAFARDEVGDLLQFVVSRLGIGVRQEEEIVDALEFLAVDVGGGRQIEHVLEADGRLLAFTGAFADEAGPHGVM
jgi:hypothetical protein